MRRWIVPIMVFAATGLILSVAGLFRLMSRDADGAGARVLEPDPLSLGLTVPEFSLTDQDGRPATQAILDGRVTIIDFIFTNCPFVCPGMMVAMSDLAAALKGTGVRFASFSVDPAHDSPERLREYAAANYVDLSRWTLLTGDRATLTRIVSDSLKFALQPDPSRQIGASDGTQMDNITHPGKLLLIGPDRRVLGFFDPNRQDEMQRLLVKARLVAKAIEGER